MYHLRSGRVLKFLAFFSLSMVLLSGVSFANAAVSNGALTENDIEWCHDVYPHTKH